MRLKFQYLSLVLMVLFMKLGAAEENMQNPLPLIQNASIALINQLTEQKAAIAEDPRIVMDIVEKLLIPHFASNTISRKVLGVHAKKITKEQKEQFAKAFRFYMVRYYAKIFSAFSNQTFKFLAAPKTEGKKKVYVKTQLIQAGSKPVSINYKMQRSGDSWKIIDLKIEGISMVISNKKQFVRQISSDGIDTVIAKLNYKNNKALADE